MRTRRGLSLISHIEESYKPYSACLKFLRKWFPGCLTTLALANHHLIGPIILAIAQHQITQGSTQTSLSSTSFSFWGQGRGVVNTASALFVQPRFWGNPFKARLTQYLFGSTESFRPKKDLSGQDLHCVWRRLRLNVARNRAKNQQSLLVSVEEMKARGVQAYSAPSPSTLIGPTNPFSATTCQTLYYFWTIFMLWTCLSFIILPL